MNRCRASLPRFEEVLGSDDAEKKQKVDAEKKQKYDAEKFEGPDKINGKKDEEARRFEDKNVKTDADQKAKGTGLKKEGRGGI